ncbi:MAG TPA: cytochrome P450 [Acidimicrobiia bacterium]|jgi:cytochrome P450
MIEFDPLDLVDPVRYARDGYPHATWTRLRAEAPVAYVEAPGYAPFWAITKHGDVVEISSQPLRFSNTQGITLMREGASPPPPSEILVMLDPPKHGPMRRLVTRRFTPKAVRAQREEVSRIAVDVVDGAITDWNAGELDAVEQLAAPFPLALIAWILGVPADDWSLLFRLSNEVIGKDDPEYRQPGESPGRTMKRARGEIHHYFQGLVAERRREPQDDLLSELLRGSLDGGPLSDEQLLSYCELLIEAGNETTRNAISGGLLAFCEHPEQWERLRAEPELLPDAVEEILRWVSPISHFTRVATSDYELRGHTIRAGEQVALYYASANRDEDVFEAPFEFRIDRRPNPHITFGFGEHFCVGAHLARVEVETVLRHLVTRLERIELAGTVVRLESAINGSIKRLPLRFRGAAAAL